MLPNARAIIRESFSQYKKNFKVFLPYILIFFIPYVLVSLMPIANVYIFSMLGGASSGSSAMKMLGLSMIAVIYLTLIIFVLWASIALTRVMNEKFGSKEEKPVLSTKEEMNKAKKYLWPVLWTGLLTALIVIGGTLLLVIPGIIFSLWYSFSSYSAMLDDKKGMPALNYSKSLVKGRWWGVFWRLFAPGFVFGVISSLVQMVVLFPLSFLTYYSDNVLINSLSIIITLAVGSLLMPLAMSAPLILYRELKSNKVTATEMPKP